MAGGIGRYGVSGFGPWAKRAAFSALGLVAALVLLSLTSSSAQAALKNVPDRFAGTNGVVYSILRVDDTIYFGGDFQRVGSTTRYNLAAIDADTGALERWNPGAACCVRTLAASPDGSRIYAGGSFMRAGGKDRRRLAAIDAATGEVSDAWDPAANFTVNALAVQGDRVFIGGQFRAVDGVGRRSLAMVSGPNGDLSRSWRPAASGAVRKLRVVGPRLYVGGTFRYLGGQPRRNLAAVLTGTGETTFWRPNPARPILDFAVSGQRVYTAEGGRYGAVASYATGGTGRRAWTRLASGDAQAVAVMDGRLYVGGHFLRLSGQPRYRAAALFPGSGKLDPRWTPRFSSGIWALAPDPARGRLYAGGGFRSISGRPQSGIARFARLP